MFGSVRNGGLRFHEGIDIRPVVFDAAKKPVDPIYAFSSGVVVHTNLDAGDSSYGRYIVIVHDTVSPPIYTLYAHLDSVAAGIRPGVPVRGGQTIGIMGRTSSVIKLTTEQTHLHFEVGLILSESFDDWYKLQDFDTLNKHTVWNGTNLVGVDPLAFIRNSMAAKTLTSESYFKSLPNAVKIRISTREIPDFIKRYPEFLTRLYSSDDLVGWDIGFTWFGLPKEWTPLTAGEQLIGKSGSIKVLGYDTTLLKANPSKKMVNLKNGTVGSDLEKHMEILFNSLRKSKKKKKA